MNICQTTSPKTLMMTKRYVRLRQGLRGNVGKPRVTHPSALGFNLILPIVLCLVLHQVFPRIFFEAISNGIDRNMGMDIQATSRGTLEEDQNRQISALVVENQAIGVETVRPNQPLQQQAKITIKDDSSVISGMMIRLMVLKDLNCLCKNSCVFSGF